MGRKELHEYTKQDIKEFKRDIENYQKKQKLFLTLGFIFLGLFFFFLILTIFICVLTYFNLREGEYYAAQFLFILFDYLVGSLTFIFMIGFIAMFVVRGAVFNGKIENRRRIIEDWEELQNNPQEEKKEEPLKIEEKPKEEEQPVVPESKSDIEEI